MEGAVNFLVKHKFVVVTVIILLIAVFFRFYNFDHRYGLAYDQAHDALVARSALEQHKLPLLGPFSSAGPFVTGPEWYWFIALGTIIFPFSILTPWVVLAGLYTLFVY